jgi:hypothetical protein
MSIWDDVKAEIQSNPVLKDRFGSDEVVALEELLECYYMNVMPSKDLDPQDWRRIRTKIELVENDIADRRRGDRRKLCPYEDMSKGTWEGLCEVKEFVYPRSPGRRRTDLKTSEA